MDRFLNQIICGDCLTVMRDIPDKSVDLVLTDPPYLCEINGGAGMAKTWNSRNNFFEMIEDFSEYAKEMHRILKDNSHCIVFTNSKSLQNSINQFTKVFKFIDLLTMVKNNAYPIGGYYLRNTEFALLLTKGFKRINDETQKNIFYAESVKNEIHPTIKPLSVIEKMIIQSTQKEQVVLDPFLGSGTTAVAAHNTGRFFIGIEKEPKYVEIARKRVEQAQAQQSLFGTE